MIDDDELMIIVAMDVDYIRDNKTRCPRCNIDQNNDMTL